MPPKTPAESLPSEGQDMLFSPANLKAWIAENRQLFDPPFRTNRVIAHQAEFIVMMLAGPNARLDFHFEPGEEFFYQVEGDIELHLKPDDAQREVVKIREGAKFSVRPILPIRRGAGRTPGGLAS